MENSVTILDCIQRIPSLIEKIIVEKDINIAKVLKKNQEKVIQINKIIIVGSGTSDTAARTAKNFIIRITKIPTFVYTPSEFELDTVEKNSETLYIFVSQTGTSKMTRKAAQEMNSQNYFTIAISESATTLLATEIPNHILMGVGYEEHPTRTIGYTTTAMTLMALGIELALIREVIDIKKANQLYQQALKAAQHQKELVPQTMAWLDKNRRKMMRSSCIFFITSEELMGVAKESAMKIWEIPQIPAIAYEIEESLHGPNYGYTPNHCVIVLNDGGSNENKYLALTNYMKDIKQNGFIIGKTTIDEEDLLFSFEENEFKFIEFSVVIQVLAYRLALDGGRDLLSPHDNSVMYSYFTTHEGD
ncbi:glucoselysine-6-phosphate deglycase [Enterococcus sp. PF1-24]|uniref:SIS domain-containing protein n=1 Tax=unclassified Enterococcus TaxID=2608891 RepID=UPI002474C2E7|nr:MULTISPECIES: SIS domain-containing protein [unclassified Enterococcus]MDH6365414.1 glucoselysine-6-phosphate deglycase [Enterococcus sp. PFB1-1]MDH6402514.1 glucoselysine-6-phosphate deglycase [Enterococcus sp. PF1-24]